MPGSRREELLASAGDRALAVWLGRLQDASFQPGRGGAQGVSAGAADDRTTAGRVPGAPDVRARVLHPARRPSTRRTDAVLPIRGGVLAPTLGTAARLGNVRAHRWPALSIIEGEHDTHAAVLTEGPAEVLATAPDDVRSITELRNRGATLDWATYWLRMTPQRLFSFAELAWQGLSPSS